MQERIEEAVEAAEAGLDPPENGAGYAEDAQPAHAAAAPQATAGEGLVETERDRLIRLVRVASNLVLWVVDAARTNRAQLTAELEYAHAPAVPQVAWRRLSANSSLAWCGQPARSRHLQPSCVPASTRG